MISHLLHDHPRTPAARAQCRDRTFLAMITTELDAVEARIIELRRLIRGLPKRPS